MVFRYSVCAVIGYLLGSVSGAILLSRFVFKQDVRTQGSGNAGATNAARVFGLGAGLLTFLFDFLKCVLAMFLGGRIAGTAGMVLAGAACLIGHCFPDFSHFRGGKAVSAGAAVGLMIDWRLFLLIMVVFLLLAFACRRVSLASISASIALAACACLFTKEPLLLVLAVFTCILVIVMHRGNIKRLLNGTEPAFKPGHRKQ